MVEPAGPNAQLRRAVRGFYAWIGSVAFAAGAPILAAQLVESHSAPLRAAGVFVGSVGWIPMVIVITLIIRRGDEFTRRIHLIAMSLAFLGALMSITVVDWLVRAEFVAPPPLSILWLVFAVLWFVSLVATKQYFERRP